MVKPHSVSCIIIKGKNVEKVNNDSDPTFEYIPDEIRCQFPLLILSIGVLINQSTTAPSFDCSTARQQHRNTK
jgi:hypothetical protein